MALRTLFEIGEGDNYDFCVAVTVIAGQLARSWLEDLPDDQAVIALLVVGGLSALLGSLFFEGFLRLWRLYRKTRQAGTNRGKEQ